MILPDVSVTLVYREIISSMDVFDTTILVAITHRKLCNLHNSFLLQKLSQLGIFGFNYVQKYLLTNVIELSGNKSRESGMN